MRLYFMLLALTTGTALALDQPIKLTDVSGGAIGKSTLITLKLSAVPAWHEVEVQSRGGFLEFKLPNIVAVDAGGFYDIDSPYVLKLMPVQVTADFTSLRMFVQESGHVVQAATTTEVAGKQIFITIDHRQLEKNLVTATASRVDGIADTPVQSTGTFTEKMQQIGIGLLIVAGLIMILFWLWRVAVFLSQKRKEDKDVLPLQTICQLHLTRGQKLCLVEVYGQKMLLAVSSDRTEVLLHSTRNSAHSPLAEGVTGNKISPPPVSPQRNGDVCLNQHSLSAQKSMQRNQHFNRETLTTHPVQVEQAENKVTETENRPSS